MSDKKIEDYLHLYLGCRFVLKLKQPSKWKYSADIYFGVDAYKAFLAKSDDHIDPILLLRRLDSMTEEEHQRYHDLGIDTGTCFEDMKIDAIRTKYLLSKHFDLFGLIDSGLAIDSALSKQHRTKIYLYDRLDFSER